MEILLDQLPHISAFLALHWMETSRELVNQIWNGLALILYAEVLIKTEYIVHVHAIHMSTLQQYITCMLLYSHD